MIKRGFWPTLGRFLSTALLVGMVAGVVYLHLGAPPFAAIAGGSMEPNLHQGDLVLVSPVDPDLVQVGDVVVVRVPGMIRERHGYPQSIVHRVTEIHERGDGRSFRLQGDNNPNEDPFTALPGDIQGEVQRVVPHVGYGILFLYSRQGLAFLIAVSIIYVISIIMDWLEYRARTWRHDTLETLTDIVAAGVTKADKRQDPSLRGPPVEVALDRFAGAMEEYATHLHSHTSAVQGLAAGAGSLETATERQNQILHRLEEILAGKGREDRPPFSPAQAERPAAVQELRAASPAARTLPAGPNGAKPGQEEAHERVDAAQALLRRVADASEPAAAEGSGPVAPAREPTPREPAADQEPARQDPVPASKPAVPEPLEATGGPTPPQPVPSLQAVPEPPTFESIWDVAPGVPDPSAPVKEAGTLEPQAETAGPPSGIPDPPEIEPVSPAIVPADPEPATEAGKQPHEPEAASQAEPVVEDEDKPVVVSKTGAKAEAKTETMAVGAETDAKTPAELHLGDDPACTAALRVLWRAPALEGRDWTAYVDDAGGSFTACSIDFPTLKRAAASWGPQALMVVSIAEASWHEHRKFYNAVRK